MHAALAHPPRTINEAQLRANLASLPPLCYTTDPTTGEPIMIRRGAMGFEHVEFAMAYTVGPDALNAYLTPVPTADEVEAMEIGAQFGWDVPGAHPEAVVVGEGGQ